MLLSSAKRVLFNQRGSAVVESSLSITVVCTILIGGFSVLYFSFARVWVSRSGYEGLICLSTRAAQSECEQRFKSDTAAALPIGKLSDVHMSRTARRAEIRMNFAFGEKTVFSLRDSLELPLKSVGTQWNHPSFAD